MHIYVTTNILNGKKYIGKEKNNNYRYLGSGKLLRRAFKKYGKHNFKKEIIEYCVNEEQLNVREKYWIDYYNAANSKEFYNIAYGGEGGNTVNRPYKGMKKKDIYGESWVSPNKGNSVLKKYKDDIIDMYVNKKLSLTEISHIYNCFKGTVKRLLVNNNIEINIHKGLEKAKEVIAMNSIVNTIGDKIVHDFNAGMSIPDIDKKYKISSTGRVLKHFNIKRFPNRYPGTHRPIVIKNIHSIIRDFTSLKECALFLGASVSEVCSLANRKRTSLKGWCLADECISNIRIKKQKIIREDKKIIKNGVIIRFKKFTDIVKSPLYKEHNFRVDSLCALFKGNITNHRGWTVLRE